MSDWPFAPNLEMRYAIGNPAQNSTWQTKSLEAAMNGFGHSGIDVLKMDTLSV